MQAFEHTHKQRGVVCVLINVDVDVVTGAGAWSSDSTAADNRRMC